MTHCQRRLGKSLIEVLVVITLLSGALGICAFTLTTLFRTEVQLRRDREQQSAAARLADLWRADAHVALSCTADKECIFSLPGGRQAKYAIDGATIRREVARGGALEHRDAFRLPLDAVPAFSLAKIEDRDFAVLSIQPSGTARPYGTPVRPTIVEAVVNLHGVLRPTEEEP